MCRLLALAPLLFVIACGRSEPSETNHPAVAPLASSVATDRVLVIRTDFADDARWRAAWAGIMTPWQVHERVPEVSADVDALDDRSFSGISIAELVPRLQGYQPRYVFVADAETMSAAGHPVIVV